MGSEQVTAVSNKDHHEKPTDPRAVGQGTLVIIGGHEDKHPGDILARVADLANRDTVVVATLASSVAEDNWTEYEKVFCKLGVKVVRHLDIPDRSSAFDSEHLKTLDGASLIFFTGGDQLEITTKIGGTEICEKIQEMYRAGVAIAGTSAGASVMSETMLVGGADQKNGESVNMAPGLGFLRHVVIDQHFAQRGRISRLLAVVAKNPRMLGIGIDENTAIIVSDSAFEVMGEGSVYVVDARAVTATNLSTEEESRAMSIYNLKLHVLNSGDAFDLTTRQPLGHAALLDPAAQS